MPSNSLCLLAALTMFALPLRRSTVRAGLVAADTPRTLERIHAARAPTVHHTSRVHAQANAPLVRGAKRPNLGPTRRTRGPRLAARRTIPLESTGARRGR